MKKKFEEKKRLCTFTVAEDYRVTIANLTEDQIEVIEALLEGFDEKATVDYHFYGDKPIV
jgi:hypothetical protein